MSSGIQGVTSLGSAINSAQAASAQGEYQRMQYDTNARLARVRAADAIERGSKDAHAVHNRGRRVVAAQAAGYAAQGVDVNTGTPADIQAQSARMSAEDTQRVHNNAWREAWGFEVEAQNFTGAGRMAELAANTSAKMTLLTGGMQALGYGFDAAAKYHGRKR
jgi:hypothetical protein